MEFDVSTSCHPMKTGQAGRGSKRAVVLKIYFLNKQIYRTRGTNICYHWSITNVSPYKKFACSVYLICCIFKYEATSSTLIAMSFLQHYLSSPLFYVYYKVNTKIMLNHRQGDNTPTTYLQREKKLSALPI